MLASWIRPRILAKPTPTALPAKRLSIRDDSPHRSAHAADITVTWTEKEMIQDEGRSGERESRLGSRGGAAWGTSEGRGDWGGGYRANGTCRKQANINENVMVLGGYQYSPSMKHAFLQKKKDMSNCSSNTQIYSHQNIVSRRKQPKESRHNTNNASRHRTNKTYAPSDHPIHSNTRDSPLCASVTL